jgi:hypothetical protein
LVLTSRTKKALVASKPSRSVRSGRPLNAPRRGAKVVGEAQRFGLKLAEQAAPAVRAQRWQRLVQADPVAKRLDIAARVRHDPDAHVVGGGQSEARRHQPAFPPQERLPAESHQQRRNRHWREPDSVHVRIKGKPDQHTGRDQRPAAPVAQSNLDQGQRDEHQGDDLHVRSQRVGRQQKRIRNREQHRRRQPSRAAPIVPAKPVDDAEQQSAPDERGQPRLENTQAEQPEQEHRRRALQAPSTPGRKPAIGVHPLGTRLQPGRHPGELRLTAFVIVQRWEPRQRRHHDAEIDQDQNGHDQRFEARTDPATGSRRSNGGAGITDRRWGRGDGIHVGCQYTRRSSVNRTGP